MERIGAAGPSGCQDQPLAPPATRRQPRRSAPSRCARHHRLIVQFARPSLRQAGILPKRAVRMPRRRQRPTTPTPSGGRATRRARATSCARDARIDREREASSHIGFSPFTAPAVMPVMICLAAMKVKMIGGSG